MLDWDDLRFFLAVARHGNLTSAAKALGVSQSTVGRRIDQFEANLGAKLFQRTPSGFSPSVSGREVLAHVEGMEDAAFAIEHRVFGRDAGLQGRLCVTASEWLAIRILGPMISDFGEVHPEIALELIADTRWLSLPRREADVAFRPSPYTHQEVFQRELSSIAFGLYASRGYLAKHGKPDFGNQCSGHRLLLMNDGPPEVADRSWLESLAPKARVAAQANGREMLATMAATGAGLVCLPRYIGDANKDLWLIMSPTQPPERKLWLGLHRHSKVIPRVRAFVDFAVEAFATLRSELCPLAENAPRRIELDGSEYG